MLHSDKLASKDRRSKDGVDELKELAELEKLAPRISEYFELWEEKAGKGAPQKGLRA